MKASGLYGSSQIQYLHCKEEKSCQTFIHHTGMFTRQLCLNIASAAHEDGMQGLRHVEVLTQALCRV